MAGGRCVPANYNPPTTKPTHITSNVLTRHQHFPLPSHSRTPAKGAYCRRFKLAVLSSSGKPDRWGCAGVFCCEQQNPNMKGIFQIRVIAINIVPLLKAGRQNNPGHISNRRPDAWLHTLFSHPHYPQVVGRIACCHHMHALSCYHYFPRVLGVGMSRTAIIQGGGYSISL